MKKVIVLKKESINIDGIDINISNQKLIDRLCEINGVSFDQETTNFTNELIFSVINNDKINEIKKIKFVECVEDYYEPLYKIYHISENINNLLNNVVSKVERGNKEIEEEICEIEEDIEKLKKIKL
jgi:hypothetical protein